MNRDHLPALTGLRFFAALAIVLLHYSGMAEAHGGILPTLIANIVQSGQMGVCLFFVLSGFVLAYVYLTPDGLKGTAGAFWVARFARVYPAYGLALVACIVAGVLWQGRAIPAVPTLATGLLLQAWDGHWDGVWNIPGWTLSVEACFYAAFPLVATVVARLDVRRMPALLLACYAALVLPPLWWLASGSPAWGAALGHNPAVHLPEFLIGMAACRLYLDGRAAWVRPGPVALLLLAAMAAGPAVPFILLHNGLYDPLCALLIYGLARGGGGMVRALAHPALVALGDASYTVYIMQVPVWLWLDHLLHAPAPGAPGYGPYFLGYLALLIAVSLLCHRLVEQPARAAIRRAWDARARRLVPVRAAA